MRKAFRTSAAMLAITASTALGGTLLTAAPATAAPAPAAAVTTQQAASGVSAQAAASSTHSKAVTYMKMKHTTFVKQKKVKPFNWTNDGCSVPTGYAPYMKTFTKACVQHDFGYRNFGKARKDSLKLEATKSRKGWIDSRFKAEMKTACKTKYKKGNPLKACNTAANAYWLAVNVGGNKSFFG